MLRSALSKVAWVGRTASMVFGLALVMALVFGGASVALAGNLDPLKIGSLKNAATKTTQLVGKVATGEALVVKNPSGGPALGLQVNAGQAPVTVNAEAGTATGLSADKLDGMDSSAFGVKTSTVFQWTDQCDTANTWNECAQVLVTVPAGKSYLVSVWSEFTARGAASNQDVQYCSAVKAPGQTQPSCLPPVGTNVPHSVTVEAGQYAAAGSSGETASLPAGTYTFSTAINPQAEFAFAGAGKAITKVMVRDASGAAAIPASAVSKVQAEGAASRER